MPKEKFVTGAKPVFEFVPSTEYTFDIFGKGLKKNSDVVTIRSSSWDGDATDVTINNAESNDRKLRITFTTPETVNVTSAEIEITITNGGDGEIDGTIYP